MGITNDYIINELQTKIDNIETKNTYINKLTTLSSKLNKPIYEILKDPDESFKNIQSTFPNSSCTQRNFVNAILSVFRTIKIISNKKPKIYLKWRNIYEKLGKIKHDRKPLVINRKDIESKYTTLNHTTKKTSQELILLSLILNKIPIKYNTTIIVYPKHISSSSNYIFLKDNTTSYCVINKKKYKMNIDLYNDCMASVNKYPREYLFTDSNNNGYNKSNSFSVFVIRSFEEMFGQKVSLSDIKLTFI